MQRSTRTARWAAFTGGVAALLAGGVVFAGSAVAHHPEIEASWACDGTVSYTAHSWAGTTPEEKTNPSILVFWTDDQGGNFRHIAESEYTMLPSGHFGADNDYRFSGSFTTDTDAPTIGVHVREGGPWANGTPARSNGSFDDSQFVRLSRPTGCEVPEPVKVLPVETTPECPEGPARLASHAYDITRADGSVANDVAQLRGQVDEGDVITATFTVAEGCEDLELTLATYRAPGPVFDRGTADEQVLFDHGTGTFDAGPGSLTATVPACFYQADFAFGPVIERFDPEFYGSRLIDADNGGSGPCVPDETETPTETETETEVEDEVVEQAPTPAPAAAPAAVAVPTAVPSATVADAVCADGGALVSLANTGDAPVTFTIVGGATPVTRTIAGGGQVGELVALPEGPSTITVSAPGMADVSRAVTLDCAEVAGVAVVAPAAPTARSQAATPEVAAASTAPGTLPRTGADSTIALLLVGLGLLATGALCTTASARRR